MLLARSTRALVALATVASLAVACSDDGGSATTTTRAPTTATTAPASTTTDPPSEEEAILAAVEGYWQTIREAWDPPNPDLPGFGIYFTGSARQASVDTVVKRRELNQGVRLPDNAAYGHDFVVVAIDDDQATVHDCAIDDSVLFDRRSGAVLNNEVATDLWEMTLVREDNQWRVSNNTILRSWEGVTECDES